METLEKALTQPKLTEQLNCGARKMPLQDVFLGMEDAQPFACL
jgi:hypothetical protein